MPSSGMLSLVALIKTNVHATVSATVVPRLLILVALIMEELH
jgi:hypothetical protein